MFDPQTLSTALLAAVPEDGSSIGNLFELSHEAGIARHRVVLWNAVLWNAVPWYIGNGRKIRAANTQGIREGLSSLTDLVALLGNVRGVALLGKKAQKSKGILLTIQPQLTIFECPHPSPLFVNRRPENRAIMLGSLLQIQQFIEC